MQFGWRCPLLAAAAAGGAAVVVEVEEGRIGRALSALCCANTRLDISQVGAGSKQQEEGCEDTLLRVKGNYETLRDCWSFLHYMVS